jgi:aspartyl protease family protein
VTVYGTEVSRLRIGNIELQDVRASITPSMAGDTILLGMSALQQVEFSQRGSTLTLRQYPEQ